MMNTSANGQMISCLGLSNSAIEEFCALLEAENKYCRIANLNCCGNITLSVAGEFKAEILSRLAALGPKQLFSLELGGPWHCSLLTSASNSFRKYLDSISFEPVSIPVVDNCTGELLPDDPVKLRDQLANHLILPVRWEDGINTLIANGINTFVEIGHGSMLSNFGFFIDRTSKFIPFHS
jgi:[acyl-carrier-protein] S-malonyltransferase